MIWDRLKRNGPYQPFTFRGVAAFADASARRVVVFQVSFALLAAASVVWFVNTAWAPVVARAILELPPQGEINAGELLLPDSSPRLLADSRLLSFAIDPQHSGLVRVPSHIQVEFGARDVRVSSLFGYANVPYSREHVVAFNRPGLEPWWGAWRPPLLWILFGATAAGLMVTWWMLATFYSLPLWVAGVFQDRRLTLRGAWKLAATALMPGCVVMIGGIVAYGAGMLGMIELLVLQGVHWIVGWIFCAGGIAKRPRSGDVANNPFETEAASSPAKTLKPENPFSDGSGSTNV